MPPEEKGNFSEEGAFASFAAKIVKCEGTIEYSYGCDFRHAKRVTAEADICNDPFLWAVYTVMPRLLSKGRSPVPFPGCIEGPQPFDFHSAGGDMCVAEERLKAASAIGFRP